MSNFEAVADRVRASDPTPERSSLPEAMWDSATLLEVVDRRAGARASADAVPVSDGPVAPQVAVPPRWRSWKGPMVAVGAAIAVLIVVAASLLLVGSPETPDVTDTPPPVTGIESPSPTSGDATGDRDEQTEDGQDWSTLRDTPFVWTGPTPLGPDPEILESAIPAVVDADAWQIVTGSGIEHHAGTLRGVSFDEVWIKGGLELYESKSGSKSWRCCSPHSLYRAVPDGDLHRVDDRFPRAEVDSNGIAWRATPKKLENSRGEEWTFDEVTNGHTVVLGLDGSVWVRAQDESCPAGWWREGMHPDWRAGANLYRLQDARLIRLPCGSLPNMFIDQMEVGSDGTIYLTGRFVEGVGTANELLSAERSLVSVVDGEVTRLEPPVTERSELWAAPNGDIWLTTHSLGHRSFVVRFDGETWHTYDSDSVFGATLQRIGRNRIAIGPDSRVWVANGAGLAMFDGDEWSYLLEGEEVTKVSAAPDGTLWVGIGTTVHRFPSEWQNE